MVGEPLFMGMVGPKNILMRNCTRIHCDNVMYQCNGVNVPREISLILIDPKLENKSLMKEEIVYLQIVGVTVCQV